MCATFLNSHHLRQIARPSIVDANTNTIVYATHTMSPVLANLIAHMTVNTIAHNNAPTRQIDSARDKLLFMFEGNIIVPHYCGLDSAYGITILHFQENKNGCMPTPCVNIAPLSWLFVRTRFRRLFRLLVLRQVLLLEPLHDRSGLATPDLLPQD